VQARFARPHLAQDPRRHPAPHLRLLKRCRFRDIQRAVNLARNGTRILILPGVYKELPSRRKPLDDRAALR